MIETIRNPTAENWNSRNLYLTGKTREGRDNKEWKLPKKWHFLIDVQFDITQKCCDILKKNALYKFNKTGVFVGTVVV